MAVAVQIYFGKSRTHPLEPLADAVAWYLAALQRNGNILRHWTIAEADSSWMVYGVAPARDAFRNANQSEFVRRRLRELKAAHVPGPTARFLGAIPETASDCECAKPEALFLFATFLHVEPPVWCMDCNRVVPLYRLPRSKSSKAEEYSALLAWQSNYQACDSLQINCTVGERFGERQMSDLTSSLTVSGLNICKELERQTGLHVYYYLFRSNSRSRRAEAARRCPNCGGEWRLNAPLHGKFDFKCDRCHLLSNVAWNVR
jgi:predicted  nucleic acid-binding Zn ribbon protein